MTTNEIALACVGVCLGAGIFAPILLLGIELYVSERKDE